MEINNTKIEDIENILKHHIPKPEGKYGRNSVMVLLFNINNELHVLYNKRALTLKYQPGDICFPGGKSEPGETPLQTALRETNEELGLLEKDIKLLGTPDFIVTPFNTIVTPFIGFVENINPADINYSRDEVDSIFTVPLKFFRETKPIIKLLDFDANMSDEFPVELIAGGKNYKWGKSRLCELFYEYDGHVIWGITARITNHICNLIEGKESYLWI